MRERRRMQRMRQRRLMIGVGAVALLVLVAFAFRFQPRVKAEAVSLERLADDPSLGPADAPVTIIEYGDFGCPSCRAWHNAGILAQIRAQYGDQVRFVWRDFPVITVQSPKAAEAAQCAYDQDKFWEYHNLLFERASVLGVDNLKAYAADLGLNTGEFNRCLDSGKHKATVKRDWQDAEAHGFLGTPSFLINDKPLVGPPTYAFLQREIDGLLSVEH